MFYVVEMRRRLDQAHRSYSRSKRELRCSARDHLLGCLEHSLERRFHSRQTEAISTDPTAKPSIVNMRRGKRVDHILRGLRVTVLGRWITLAKGKRMRDLFCRHPPGVVLVPNFMPWSYVSKHHFGPPGAWLVYEQYSTPAKKRTAAHRRGIAKATESLACRGSHADLAPMVMR